MNYKIIFIGTGEFAAPILRKLAKSEFKPVAIITQPDRPVGRKQIMTPPPVKCLALKYNITIYQPKKIKSEETEKWLKEMAPDLIVVAEYGQIIPKKILDIPKYGALNVHPSLLPKYRGPSPIQYAILNDDNETGVTIILMDEKIDHGPILSSEKLKVKSEKLIYIYSELLKILANLGGELLIDVLPKWFNGKIKPVPQDETRATYTKILTKEDGKIHWQKSAKEIERQIRAFFKWPTSWCVWQYNNKKLHLKILKAKILHPTIGCAENTKTILERRSCPVPGFVFKTTQKEMAVNCHPGSLIIRELQLEGKDIVSGKEFLRGYPKIVGSVLL